MSDIYNPVKEAYAGILEGLDLEVLEDRLADGLSKVVGSNANNRVLALMILNTIIRIQNDGAKRVIEEVDKHLETLREFNRRLDDGA